ncbi:hypothetical protein [Rhodopirellula europaea]|uniref:hypothetical protein n=1 Tax=Rhodopirellula europaea TaxID=1263866 RepID=UPI003D2E9BD9
MSANLIAAGFPFSWSEEGQLVGRQRIVAAMVNTRGIQPAFNRSFAAKSAETNTQKKNGILLIKPNAVVYFTVLVSSRSNVVRGMRSRQNRKLGD